MRRLLFALLLPLGLACGPNPKAPVKVMALVINNQGVYETRQVELGSIGDVVAFRGSVAHLVGGARIVIDGRDPLLAVNGGNPTDAQLEEIFVKGRGGDPRGSYIEKAGILWPADFHTWNMTTTYYNFEKAYLYFQALYGEEASKELLETRVYYFPEFILAESSPAPQKDNALYFSPIQAFAILPFDKLTQVPLSINLGIVGHEFSHRVFNKKVYGGASVPAPLVRWSGLGTAAPGVNILKSVDEGLADFHGYGITCSSEFGCNPRYLDASFTGQVTDDRDLSKPNKCMTAALRDALGTQSAADFNRQGLEYKVGSTLAAALYQAGNKTGKIQVLQKAVISAYNDPDPKKIGISQLITQNLETPQNFKIEMVANSILAHIADLELRKLTCNEMLERLQIPACDVVPCAALPDCPASSAKGTSNCPNINQ